MARLARFAFIVVAALLVFGGFSNAVVHAQQASSPVSVADWPTSSFNYQNTNYDPQTVINSNNVQYLQLQLALPDSSQPLQHPWRPAGLGIETQSIVSQGIKYLATPYNHMIALNSATGTWLW